MYRERLCWGDRGVTLVELIVALAILGIVMTGLSSTLINVLDLSRDNASRVMASNLASSALEQLRVLPFSDEELDCTDGTLCGIAENDPDPTWTETIDGRDFELTRTVEWTSNLADIGACIGAIGEADENILRLSVEVVWSRQRGARPVVAEGAVSPPVSPDSSSSGTIAVFVADHEAEPVPNVEVTLVGPAPSTSQSSQWTDADGCAVFQGLVRGEYTTSLSDDPVIGNTYDYIDIDQRRSPDVLNTTTTAPRIWSSLELFYSEAGALQVEAAGWASGAEPPIDALPWFTTNERTGSPYRFASTSVVAELFPGQYNLGAGHCADRGVAPRVESPVMVESGLQSSRVGSDAITLGAFEVGWSAQVLTALSDPDVLPRVVELTALPPTAATAADGCYEGVVEIALPSVDEGETSRRFALPFSFDDDANDDPAGAEHAWTIVARVGGVVVDSQPVVLRVQDIAAGVPPPVVFDYGITGPVTPDPEPPTGPVLWLDADDAATVIRAADDSVSEWRDRSGNDRHVSQSNGARQPTYVSGQLNGRPVVSFFGDHYLRRDYSSGMFGATDLAPRPENQHTIFVVGQASGGSGHGNIWDAGTLVSSSGGLQNNATFNIAYIAEDSDGPANRFLTSLGGRQGGGNNWADDSPNTSDGNTDWNLLSSRWDGANHAFYVNTALRAGHNTVGVSLAQNSPFLIGAAGNGEHAHLDGAIAEVIIYDRALDDTERAQVESYLQTKWGVPTAVSPPVTPDCDGTLEERTQQWDAAGTYSVTVPAGCTTMTVQAWGAGGGGGEPTGDVRPGGAGGGGGAFAGGAFSVGAGDEIGVFVGAGGQAETAGGASTVGGGIVAAGGGAGTTVGGVGGAVADSTGSVVFGGGDGGDRGRYNSVGDLAPTNGEWGGGGGGGGSARADAGGAAGEDGAFLLGGTGGAGQGQGGRGGNDADGGAPAAGDDGEQPGAGGGGRGWFTEATPGRGADGRVVIVWSAP